MADPWDNMTDRQKLVVCIFETLALLLWIPVFWYLFAAWHEADEVSKKLDKLEAERIQRFDH